MVYWRYYDSTNASAVSASEDEVKNAALNYGAAMLRHRCARRPLALRYRCTVY
jgi:hypothetical protein